LPTLIPDINPQTIENEGERLFYEAAAKLPTGYIVLYSFKYRIPESSTHAETVREADFVIIHPTLGFLTIEVKQGEVGYKSGRWHHEQNGVTVPLKKNPVEQARSAMFAILELYSQATKNQYFPLRKKYAVAFPQCNHLSGTLPPDLERESIFLEQDLSNLETKIRTLFPANQAPDKVTAAKLQNILSPSFTVFVRLDKQIEEFNRQAERLLTAEQERILDETELDSRKIFFGSAGTGKTFLAMEKANRLAAENRRVLLTCFNKHLAAYMRKSLTSPKITVANFHDFLLRTLQKQDPKLTVPKDPGQFSSFFQTTLPDATFDHFSSLPEAEKFDALVVDEGQDFREEWFTCLESMLKQDGLFYIFADPGQSLFNEDSAFLKKLPHAKHRLTQNLRNTEAINNWLNTCFPQNASPKSRLSGGIPVTLSPFQNAEEEKRRVTQEAGRLIHQGIRPKRIVILSPNTKEKSSLAATDSLGNWPLAGLNDPNPHAIRFSTIRSFKGLEADIVFLIGLKEWNQACTPSDVYVGASRARFLLHIFHQQDFDLLRQPKSH
jgi:hypothetical protein